MRASAIGWNSTMYTWQVSMLVKVVIRSNMQCIRRSTYNSSDRETSINHSQPSLPFHIADTIRDAFKNYVGIEHTMRFIACREQISNIEHKITTQQHFASTLVT